MWCIDVKPSVVQKWAMARDDPYFRLRVPEDLLAKVQAAAADSHRSVTAEMIARLESTFTEELDLTPAEVVAAIHEYDQRIEALERRMRDVEEEARLGISGP